MRPVLFVLEPLGTGKAWRALAIAEQLKRLFPALAPHFLAGPAAATLLRAAGPFPVEETLAPVLPSTQCLETSALDDSTLALAAAAGTRRLGPHQGREAVRVAKALRADLVVVDGLFAAPPMLRSAGFDVAFLTDHLLDAPVRGGVAQRALAGMLRRSVIASTSLRFFVGEPSYLASPELRVWSRTFFRYTGPISGLARLNLRECATWRDDLGLARSRIAIVAAGSAFAAPAFKAALEALERVARARRESGQSEIVVKLFPGPELTVDDPRVAPAVELPRWLAIADLAVIPGGLSLLSECAGLGLPTLALPLAGHPLQQRQTDYFAERFGVRRLVPKIGNEPTVEQLARQLGEMVAQPDLHRPHDAPDAEAQRRNADFVADLLAERLGRRRPTSPAEVRGATGGETSAAPV